MQHDASLESRVSNQANPWWYPDACQAWFPSMPGNSWARTEAAGSGWDYKNRMKMMKWAQSKKNALTWGQRDKGRERQLVWQGGSITFGSWIPADPWVRRGIKIKMESWAQEKHVWYIWNSSCYIYILFPRSFWCFWICMQRQYFLHQAKYIYYGLDLFSDSAH